MEEKRQEVLAPTARAPGASPAGAGAAFCSQLLSLGPCPLPGAGGPEWEKQSEVLGWRRCSEVETLLGTRGDRTLRTAGPHCGLHCLSESPPQHLSNGGAGTSPRKPRMRVTVLAQHLPTTDAWPILCCAVPAAAMSKVAAPGALERLAQPGAGRCGTSWSHTVMKGGEGSAGRTVHHGRLPRGGTSQPRPQDELK